MKGKEESCNVCMHVDHEWRVHVWVVLRVPAEVTQLQLVRLGVHKKVLGLDVAVANAQGVDVRQRATQLVDV